MNSSEKKDEFKVSNKQKMVDGKAAVSRITQSKARIVKHSFTVAEGQISNKIIIGLKSEEPIFKKEGWTKDVFAK